MRSVERYVTLLDEWPLSAIWRVALGYSIPPVFGRILDRNGPAILYFALFIGLLLALRIVPALLRFTLPISPDAKEAWRQRRFIAKEYDSYQWQKLFWIGLGMACHAAIGNELGWGGLAVAAFCLVGGGLGLFLWLRVGKLHAPNIS